MIASIDIESCTGCGLCVAVCPLDVLRMERRDGEQKAVITYPDDCMTCFMCEMSCPVEAVKVHPFKEVIDSPLYPLEGGCRHA